MPQVKPVKRVRTRFTWVCDCKAENNEESFTLYDAKAKGEQAKSRCAKCGQEVELTL